MRIIIASDSFKESLSAEERCLAIADGIRDVHPHARIRCVPMADGGEGTVEAMVIATAGRFLETQVTGPLGKQVTARWGMLGDASNTAVIEMAAAAGLALVPPRKRNPMRTTTFGVGELLAAAIASHVNRIIVGVGGSATVDGGVGAAGALGYTFTDEKRKVLENPLTGGDLDRIAHIVPPVDETLLRVTPIQVACDVTAPLCGPTGAAAVFGPQKGATASQVKKLDANLSHLADLMEHQLRRRVRDLPGGGAAGGLAAGLVGFCHAELRAGVDLVIDAVRLRERIAGADLIITGEGRLDAQSMMGKVIEGVGRAGQDAHVPVVALVGSIGKGAEQTREVLDEYLAISPPDMPVAEALANTAKNLRQTAARLIRTRHPVR